MTGPEAVRLEVVGASGARPCFCDPISGRVVAGPKNGPEWVDV